MLLNQVDGENFLRLFYCDFMRKLRHWKRLFYVALWNMCEPLTHATVDVVSIKA